MDGLRLSSGRYISIIVFSRRPTPINKQQQQQWTTDQNKPGGKNRQQRNSHPELQFQSKVVQIIKTLAKAKSKLSLLKTRSVTPVFTYTLSVSRPIWESSTKRVKYERLQRTNRHISSRNPHSSTCNLHTDCSVIQERFNFQLVWLSSFSSVCSSDKDLQTGDMLSSRKVFVHIGSLDWILSEKTDSRTKEAACLEDFALSARNDFEWLNEYMFETFSRNDFM